MECTDAQDPGYPAGASAEERAMTQILEHLSNLTPLQNGVISVYKFQECLTKLSLKFSEKQSKSAQLRST